MKIHNRRIIQVASIVITLALTACGGGGGGDTTGGQNNVVTSDFVDNLPANQTVAISESFLADKFSDAFQRALNSPDDKITLQIEGKLELPLPLPPPVPPGLFNGGVDVSKTVELSVDSENDPVTGSPVTYYKVSFAKDRGLIFDAKIPDLPEGDEVSVSGTISTSTKNVFRFNSPVDAATGMFDYFLLKGVWQAMTLGGYNPTGVADIANNFISYVSGVTGLNFGLTAAQINAALAIANAALAADLKEVQIEQSALNLATAAWSAELKLVNDAQALLNSKTQALDAAQAKFNNDGCNRITLKNFAVCGVDQAALTAAKVAWNTANDALNIVKSVLAAKLKIVSDVQALLDKWTSAVQAVQAQIAGLQNSLSNLPPDTVVVSVNDLITKMQDGLTFLNQNYKASSITISKATSAEAKADALGGVDAHRTRSIGFKLNHSDNTITVVIKFAGEHTLDAKLVTLASDKGEIKDTNEIEYDLSFVQDPNTHLYGLKDKGKFTIDADLSGAIIKGGDKFNRKSGAGISPVLEFSPGQELTQFGANATGVIDLSPILGIIDNLGSGTVTPADLKQAVDSTVQSFNLDQFIAAISEQTLPLTIKYYRISGLSSELGTNKEVTGSLKLSADWNDYGTPVDLTQMTVGDFADKIFNKDGLSTQIDKLVAAVQSAYQDSLAIQ